MKTLLLTLSLATAALSTAQAEIYRPSVVRETTVLGAVAGALIGGHNNDHWAQGALIGAAAGAVIGSVVDDSRPRGYGYGGRAEVAYAPVATCAPAQVVYVPRPRVVYVQSCPPPVVYRRPVVYVSRGYGYGDHRRDDRRDYRHDRRHDDRWDGRRD
jgi:hypothetical protein